MTRRPIRPPISSVGIRKEIQDTRTNKPEQERYPDRNDKSFEGDFEDESFQYFCEECKTSEKTELTGGEEVGDDVGGGMPGQHLDGDDEYDDGDDVGGGMSGQHLQV